MEFKYSFSILFSHMGYALKLLLWYILSIAITIGIAIAIAYPVYEELISTTNLAEQLSIFLENINNVVKEGESFSSTLFILVPLFKNIIVEITLNVPMLIVCIIEIVFDYALFWFIFGISQFALADIIDNMMASNLSFGFASNFIQNIRKCVLFSLCKMVVVLVPDLLYISAFLAILLAGFNKLGIFTVSILLVLTILYCATRSLLLAGWLPRCLYHQEEKIFTSLTRSMTFVKSNKNGYFKSFVLTYTIVYLIICGFTLATGGVLSLIIIPMFYFLIRTIELIGYYKQKGYNFYVDATNVINTTEYGFRSDNQEQKN